MKSPSRREVLAASVAACGALSLISATPLLAAPDRVLIPEGPFLQGTTPAQARALAAQLGYHASWLMGEVPQRTVTLPAFLIDRYPVTNRRYEVFCQATSHPTPVHWKGLTAPLAILDFPVVGIDHAEALEFAAWDGGCLPTAAEWEKAARGTDGRTFPWGNTFDPAACNYDVGGVAPPSGLTHVDAHPLGASPFGVMDLIGNAAEWCWDGPGPRSAYIKGGSWLTASALNLRCAAVGQSGADNNKLSYLGFRCMWEV